jgi:phosphohistidine swiveling domain-containing protein
MIVTENAAPLDLRQVGGKAHSLFHLMRNGIDVPPLFCIGGEAFERFIEPYRGRIRSLIHEGGASNVARTSGSIQAALSTADIDSILASSISGELLRRARGEKQQVYAVRSSALCEDSADHSFAGLFATFLYVPQREVLERVRQCWLSAYSANILQYCLHNRLDPNAMCVAVIVQEMIDSRCSGVMFTADPTGSLAETVIVAGHGVGEGIVSNRVETDAYFYNAETRSLRSTINHKRTRLVFDWRRDSGTLLEELPPELREQSVLAPVDVDRLIAAGARITQLYDHFQDIEWSIDRDGRLYILQSRPITTIPRGKLTIFDNSNIVESFPGVTSPLSFSIVRETYREVFSRMFARLLPHSYVRKHGERFEHLIGYVEGRIYYDIINWYEMYKLLPLPGSLIVAAFDNLVGLYHASNPQRFGSTQRSRSLPLTAAFAVRVLWRFVFLGSYLRSYKRRFNRFYVAARSADNTGCNLHELLGLFRRILDRYLSLASAALLNDFFLMFFIGLTKALMRRLGFHGREDLFNALMCAEGVESAIPVQDAVSMAVMLRRDDELREALMRVSSRESLELVLANPRNSAFAGCFRRHLDCYGDRCPEELKFETRTFREDPLALLKMIISYVPLEITPEKIRRSEQAVRREAEVGVARHLAGKPLQRFMLKCCIGRTRTLIANRESSRLDRGRAAGLVRAILRLIGTRLHEDKAVAAPEDIFYLTVEELSGYVYGCSLQSDLAQTIEKNRKLLARFRASAPADRLHFSGPIGRNAVYQKTPPGERTGAERILTGVSCSPGDITAEAVLVQDPASAPDVVGKIIVAQMTDPGWIFLMIVAAGLIVEKGSVLSHTAIIGREFGIPTIVGVRDATTKIRSGAIVRMRAGIGEIELC